MKIGIDAMGGDFAPAAIIEGVKLFLKEHPLTELVLTGKEDLILEELRKNSLAECPEITIYNAPDVIEMGESPVKALKNKKASSLSVLADLAKDKKVDAILSAGNTGALVASATLKMRTLPGIDRPGIATVVPTPYGSNILMDVGAVTDCKVKNLVQFAIMGSSISKKILEIPDPKVGLLSVGEEDSKGNDLTKEAFKALKEQKGINFFGNVEGRDIFKNTVNVIITDGFVGNIVLKACESLARGLFKVIKEQIKSSPLGKLGGMMLKNSFQKIARQFDHEEYGGALLLGINGVVIAAHGSSSPVAIKNALCLAVKMVENNVNQEILNIMGTEHA